MEELRFHPGLPDAEPVLINAFITCNNSEYFRDYFTLVFYVSESDDFFNILFFLNSVHQYLQLNNVSKTYISYVVNELLEMRQK